MWKKMGWPTNSVLCVSITCTKVRHAPLLAYFRQNIHKWGCLWSCIQKKMLHSREKTKTGVTSLGKVVRKRNDLETSSRSSSRTFREPWLRFIMLLMTDNDLDLEKKIRSDTKALTYMLYFFVCLFMFNDLE